MELQFTISFLFFIRIITKTGMQSLIQHSMSQMMPTVKNGNANKSDVPEETATGLQQVPGIQQAPGTGQVTNLFDPTSYRSVHNLATNTDKRNFEDLMKKTAEAIFMARCLKFNGFFGDGEEDTSEETRKAEVFISSLLLRHLQIGNPNMTGHIIKKETFTKTAQRIAPKPI